VKPARLTALSFNIHGALGRDGRRDLSRIVRLIRGLDADIVALQEVDSRPGPHSAIEQARLLERGTGLRAVAGPTLLESDRDYGNLLLVGPPLLDVERIDLSQPGREPRGAIDVRLQTTDGVLRVVATHLGLRLRERHRQIGLLLERLRGDSGPVLLMGDFNEWLPGLGILPRIHRRFVRMQSPATFPARRPLLALDRIFGRPADLIESLRIPAESSELLLASDHRPLLARLRLEAERNK
jgi:endonuclease/exonuclease/phosphatase family metal-dependent hydrolase